VSEEVPSKEQGPGDAAGASQWQPGPEADDEVTRSRLVGLMAVPISSAVPVRRSTVLMVVAFFGLGTLMAIYPPAAKTSVSNPNSGGVPIITSTTTTTTTTTTTEPSTTTTTTRPRATTTTTRVGGGNSTTTTTVKGSTTSTTLTSGTTTTTQPSGATSTTVAP